ncbi:sensor N-terminal transmembrane domain-containing protein [Aliiroseovarius sp.]|uniref:sensor N-terminal transmembrane domain-containing protein n=1 Tax=Aliiroseovarius sp. TaxID=1872442 RepID=UPI0026176B24|nr:sensor N-terminal transmembrane domain-containing protein [Aliiroseovarius sp.]
MRDTKSSGSGVVLGEDWVAPQSAVDSALRARRERRGVISINRSPLARKIITFNLLGMIVMVAGVLYLNPFRDSLVFQRETALVAEAQLVADMFEATRALGQLAGTGAVSGGELARAETGNVDPAALLANLDLSPGVEAFVFDRSEALIGTTMGQERAAPAPVEGLERDGRSTIITDLLNRVWEGISSLVDSGEPVPSGVDAEGQARSLVRAALSGTTQVSTGVDGTGSTVFSVATPILVEGRAVGAVALTSASGELDALVRSEREQVLQMFVIAILVSIGLSLVLASTIANPLSDLAAAAELGRDKNTKRVNPGRVRIPDLAGRPDEIGRLSTALRGMVAALYDRIDANEQFAADVAHEIKNPLASLRSAIGTLRFAKRDDQREKLLDVIDHDVRRLDRLVSDISNASRLDSELVKEDEEAFDLLKMLRNLTEYLGNEASEKGVDFITDLPPDPVVIQGLEARLAQVFVNLITNALSFCDDGDAIRVWARHRENRVLIVVEDTGPGIPDEALAKIFNRFYSERPEGQFGNNSGLGLAISKQIVEAHGGVIWAENIRPTDTDVTSEPLGARFVVGLPL